MTSPSRPRQLTVAAKNAVAAARATREDYATKEVNVQVAESDAHAMVSAFVSAQADAGAPLGKHDPNWFPVMVRTEVANRLLGDVVRVRTGPDDPLLPSHVAMFAITMFCQKIEQRDPLFMGYLDQIRQTVAGSDWFRPAPARVPGSDDDRLIAVTHKVSPIHQPGVKSPTTYVPRSRRTE